MSKINFIFFGTPDVAKETLQILKAGGYLPSLIITSPDAKSGRGMQIHESPTATFARENKIECLKLENISEIPECDLGIVVAYGKILPEKILKAPKHGSLNIHYSLLPKYRGASPVESAILVGEIETGVTIQQMEYKMDTGPIIAQEKINILPDETAPELRKRLIKIGGELLVKILPDFIAGKIKPTPQDEGLATYSHKIEKGDGLIDLNDSPEKNYNKFRAYAAWPRTFFFKDGKRIIITKARLENGKFVIEKIIPEGSKEQNYII